MNKLELATAAADYLCKKMDSQGLSEEERRAFVERYRSMDEVERIRLWPLSLRLRLVWMLFCEIFKRTNNRHDAQDRANNRVKPEGKSERGH